MRIVTFLLDGPESFESFVPIGRLLKALGHSVMVVDQWNQGLPDNPAREAFDARLALSDAGYETVPRLTQNQYARYCGSDLDFVACSLYGALTQDLPVDRTHMFAESPYYQRLRGFAFRIEQMLLALSPDLVIVQQGCQPVPAIVLAKCAGRRIPFLVFETPFFPERMLLDPYGMHFFPAHNRIVRDWDRVRNTPLTDSQRSALGEFLEHWRNKGISKYAQQNDPAELDLLERHITKAGGDRHRVLFVPNQIAKDANVILGIGRFRSPGQMVEYLRSALPPDWRIVVKRHPKGERTNDENFDDVRVLCVENVSVHHLIQTSDVVAAFSSNVGFEALLYGKPVVCGGVPCYGSKGLTYDLSGGKADVDLETMATRLPDPILLERFARYVIFDYLIAETDGDGLAARLSEALAASPVFADPQAPLLASFPLFSQPYVRLCRDYSALAYRNFSDTEIRMRIGVMEAPPEEPDDLHSGERQVAVTYDGVDRAHLARYAFATGILSGDPDRRVLDFGCGVGYGAALLADRLGVQITAVDSSAAAIEYASAVWERPSVTYVHASAGSFFQAPGDTFDAIVCFEVLEHLADAVRFLQQAWARLAPGGVLLGSVPNQSVYPLGAHPFHVCHYSVDSLTALIAGLAGAENFQVLGQRDATIGRDPLGRFLVFGVTKTGGLLQRIDMPTRMSPFVLDELPKQRKIGLPASHFYYFKARGERLRRIIPLDDTGPLLYGPYIALPAASYSVEFDGVISGGLGDSASDCHLSLDVRLNSGEWGTTLASATARASEFKDTLLHFDHRGSGQLEFRVFNTVPVVGANLEFRRAVVKLSAPLVQGP